MDQGARPTETVLSFLKKEGFVIDMRPKAARQRDRKKAKAKAKSQS